MAIGKDVADAISVFETLLARIEQGHVYTDEEYKAMSDMAHVLELETSLPTRRLRVLLQHNPLNWASFMAAVSQSSDGSRIMPWFVSISPCR